MQEQENKMQEIKIEKVVLSIGATGETLEKGVKLLERLTGEKAIKRISKKRIPSLDVRPGLEVGCMITLRGSKAREILKKLLVAIDNVVRRKSISENSLSFGIKEYIEIPGVTYYRDIGIMGLDVSVAFIRAGKRIEKKKIKRGRLPKKQHVTEREIEEFLEDKLNVKIR